MKDNTSLEEIIKKEIEQDLWEQKVGKIIQPNKNIEHIEYEPSDKELKKIEEIYIPTLDLELED